LATILKKKIDVEKGLPFQLVLQIDSG